ncbi:Penicillinase repressor [Planctomycetes bacterium Pla163]|jgi:BlaI family transcriptional regulator, penicillinase repressor|uniref:Penicillinase repressor n=1 Tax=Rohdeia mirabilis TaxID=2528008 RepID=A0A518CVW7_9BACT|nr:Penicillinase repressor [Planctomycetes bacterium Pla163]
MTRHHLAPAELALMERLWDAGRQTARDLREALYPGSTRAQHGTVQRLLQRLEDKGFVARDATLSVHLFEAAIGREAYAGEQLESLARKLTGGSLAPLLTHLVDEHRISADEIARLRRVLDAAGATNDDTEEDAS